MANNELQAKTQLLNVIQKIGLAQTPQALIEALPEIAIIKQATRSTIILFDSERPSHEAYAAATLDLRPNAPNLIGAVYASDTVPLFWQVPPDQPFVLENVQTDERLNDHSRQILLQLGVKSLIALALIGSDEHLGWLMIENHSRQVYAPDEVEFLKILTRHLGIAIHNYLLIQDTQASLNESQILLEANQEIFKAETVETVYAIIVQAFINSGADRCTLGTYTEFDANGRPIKSQIAAIQAASGIEPGQNISSRIGKSYDLTRYPYFTTVVDAKNVLVITDVTHAPNLSESEREYLDKMKTQALVLIPLFLFPRGNPLGYLFVEHLAPHTFSKRELALYQTIANQTTMAISNAQHLAKTEVRAQQIQTGAEISKITSSILNQNTLIAQAVNLIKSGFDLYYVGLFLIDELEQWAVLQAGSGVEGAAQVTAKHRLALDEHSMIGWSIIHQQARIAYDVGKDAVRFENPHLPLTRSEMALPLISRDKVLGALTIQSTQPTAFTDDNIASLQIMADQLANAILNSQLYQTIHNSAHKLSTLLEINHDLSASLDLQELLQLIITRATSAVKGDQGTIFLLEDNVLVPHAVTGGYEKEIMASLVQMGEGASGTAALTGKSVIKHVEIPDPQQQIPGTPAIPESLIAVPIQTEQELIGVLLIRRLSLSQKFTNAEMKLLEGMALQATIAVRNANLLATTQTARLTTENLYKMSRRLASAESVKAAANIAVQHIAEGAYDRVVFSLKDAPGNPENTWVENIAVWDVDGRQDTFLNSRFSVAEIPMIQTAGNEVAAIIPDFNDHPLVDERTKTLFTELLGVKSALILPVKIGNKILGWLLAETTHKPRSFTDADVNSVLAVVDQLGSAIDRIQKTESLLKAGEQYLSMVESIPGAVYRGRFDDHYKFIYVSDDLFGMTGYPAKRFSETGDMSLADIIHPDDLDRVRAAVRRQLQKQRPYQVQYSITHKNGQVKHFSERGRGLFEKSGAVEYVDGVVFDVTERITLAQAVQRRATQFEAIAQVGQSASAILDVDKLLAETAELISQEFGFYYAAFFLLDGKNEWAVLRAGSGEAGKNLLAENHRLKRDENSMVGWATYHGTPHVALNVEEEKHRYKNPHLPLTRSEIALPLISRGTVIGALDVQSVEENAFTNEDIATLQLMANQLANVIENARLFKSTQNSLRQANVIYQTTQALLGAKTEAELFKIFVETMSLLPVDTVSINLYGGPEDDRYFEMKEMWNRHGKGVYKLGTRFKVRDDLLSQIFYQDKTVFIEDTRTDPRLDNDSGKNVVKQGVYSLIGIPILLYGKSQGVVVISSKQADKTFAASEVRFFESLVQQLTITWQNMGLLISIERRFRREQIIRQVTGKIHATVGVDNILRTTVSELSQALDSPGGVIRLGNGQKDKNQM